MTPEFLTALSAAEEQLQPQPAEQRPTNDRPELSFYRDLTLVLLRRYFRLSIEIGRLPSLLGRELFRARVSVYHVRSFEDAVIFVHDIEQCLEQLDGFSRQLIARMVFQEYTEDEAARVLGRRRETIVRRFPEVLDKLTDLFLRGGILRPLVRPD